MFKFVNDTFIGKGVDPANLDTLAVGDVSIIDEKGATPTATSKTLSVVRVQSKKNITLPDGTVKNISMIHRSGDVCKSGLLSPEIRLIPAAAATEQITEIDLSAATIPADFDRMVMRVVFRDNEGTKTQITKTFETVSPILTAAVAGAELAKKINLYSNGALTASFAANKITITGVDNNNADLDFTSKYRQCIFEVAIYLSSTTKSIREVEIPGATVSTTTFANSGSGTACLVRDAERSSLPYKGNINFVGSPTGSPGFTVDMSKTYDTIVVEYVNSYVGSHSELVEHAPRTIEIYAEAGTGVKLETILKTFFA